VVGWLHLLWRRVVVVHILGRVCWFDELGVWGCFRLRYRAGWLGGFLSSLLVEVDSEGGISVSFIGAWRSLMRRLMVDRVG
jgi:hypothetical protein